MTNSTSCNQSYLVGAFKDLTSGVLTVAQQDQWRALGCGFDLQPVQWVKDRHCHSCSLDHNCGSNLIPAREFHMLCSSQKRISPWILRERAHR